MPDPNTLVDAHVHLDRVQGIDQNYQKIRTLVPGVRGEDHGKLKINFPDSVFATGFHPMYAHENCDLGRLKELLEKGDYSAVGECGFDRRWKNLAQQSSLFEQQIRLAADFNLPVIVHSVGHLQELVDMAKKYVFQGVIHYYAFKSLPEIFLKNGLYFGFCAKLPDQSRLGKLFEAIPIDKILIETDADESGSADSRILEQTYRDLAKIKKMDLSDLIPIISNNFDKMLNKPL
ncbi:MAG: TatD family hydrolase [Proteobacteria bacterium]|nr:TatD family hydrolase [Pseudomonadota bacterium]